MNAGPSEAQANAHYFSRHRWCTQLLINQKSAQASLCCGHKLLKRFTPLLQRTKAKVVLSSTWRYDPAGLFSAKHWGIPFIDCTPDMPHKPRSMEIKTWLKRYPQVKRFVVIDDEDDELDDLPLFQPTSKTGITQ